MRMTSKILGEKVSLEEIRLIQVENPEIIIEKDSQGALILEGLTDYYFGTLISDLLFQLDIWRQKYHSGEIMGAATSYLLPTGALRSPDISWISTAKMQEYRDGEIQHSSPFSPDFVIELRSPTDKVADLIRKMKEYQISGVRLGWIIDPIDECCYIFRATGKHEALYGFDQEVSGEGILIGFSLNLQRLKSLR